MPGFFLLATHGELLFGRLQEGDGGIHRIVGTQAPEEVTETFHFFDSQSISLLKITHPIQHRQHMEMLISDLRKAGLPE